MIALYIIGGLLLLLLHLFLIDRLLGVAEFPIYKVDLESHLLHLLSFLDLIETPLGIGHGLGGPVELEGPVGDLRAWMLWQLCGDEEAAEAFVGETAEILHNNNWQDVEKNK